MESPVYIALCILSVIASFLIMLGAKHLVPGLIRFACVLLAVLTAAPLILVWARRPCFSLTAAVYDAADSISLPALGAVVFGHLALAVALARRRLAAHSRPSPEAQERDRVRGRERVRMPPRGEA